MIEFLIEFYLKKGDFKMTKIKKLVKFIENFTHKDWSLSEWESNLTATIPDWIALIKDPQNWEVLESAKNFPAGCKKLFLEKVGVKLAKRWFELDKFKEAAKEWLRDLLSFIDLTLEIWKELSPNMKEYLIYYAFDAYPGEPFKSYRSLHHLLHHLDAYIHKSYIYLPFPQMEYIPSTQIKKLRSVIEEAKDDKFLKMVDEMIEERKNACKIFYPTTPSYPLLIPYPPTRDEKELIALAMDIFRRNGYHPSRLPEIYLSYETPPLFVFYPELEEEIEERVIGSREEPLIPRERRIRKETISIEEVCGVYIPNPKIILYVKGIKWFAEKQNIDERLLKGVVLLHEIAHWITHLLPKQGVPAWPTDLFNSSSEEVTEGWAQLITWWIVEDIGGEIKNVFQSLDAYQPPQYHVYQQFTNYQKDQVVKSLECLRQLNKPVTLTDWKNCIP